MARVLPEVKNVGRTAMMVSWTLAEGDEAVAASVPDARIDAASSENFVGMLKGSNDGSSFHPLTDGLGRQMRFSGAGLHVSAQHPMYIKPEGTGTLFVLLRP